MDGGIRLSGRFGWSSGCDHTEWAIVGVNRPQADGSKAYCLAVLPRQDYTIDDDWDSAGMQGSGSKTLVLDRVFIPDYRIQPIEDMLREGNQAYAVNQCAEAVNRLFVACGASAWPRKNPLQRLFRDMNITAAHAYTNYDLCAEAMGRELMGLAPDPAVAPAP